jgi:hypothetical protein
VASSGFGLLPLGLGRGMYVRHDPCSCRVLPAHWRENVRAENQGYEQKQTQRSHVCHFFHILLSPNCLCFGCGKRWLGGSRKRTDRLRKSRDKRILGSNASLSHNKSKLGAPDAASGEPLHLPSRSNRTDDAATQRRACGHGLSRVSGGRPPRTRGRTLEPSSPPVLALTKSKDH